LPYHGKKKRRANREEKQKIGKKPRVLPMWTASLEKILTPGKVRYTQIRWGVLRQVELS